MWDLRTPQTEVRFNCEQSIYLEAREDLKLSIFVNAELFCAYTCTWLTESALWISGVNWSGVYQIYLIINLSTNWNATIYPQLCRTLSFPWKTSTWTRVPSWPGGVRPWVTHSLSTRRSSLNQSICLPHSYNVKTENIFRNAWLFFDFHRWFKNGEILQENVNSDLVITGNILTIPNLAEKHNGMYQCAATNVHGTAMSAGQLRVLCK